MADYGDAVVQQLADGKLVVVRADSTIGISVELLAETLGEGLWVDSEGLIWLAGDPRYRYRPVRFECTVTGPVHGAVEGTRVIVCERVMNDG